MSKEQGTKSKGEKAQTYKTPGGPPAGRAGKVLTGTDLAKAVKETILIEYPQLTEEHAMNLAIMLSKIELDGKEYS